MNRAVLVLSLSLFLPGLARGAEPVSGWFAGDGAEDYSVEVAAGACGQGARLAARSAAPRGNGAVIQLFSAEKYRGMRLRYTATLKATGVSGWSGLFMRVAGPGHRTLAFDNMSTRPVRGTTGCTSHSVVLDVPFDAEVIALGAGLSGPGTVELAAPDLEAVDDSVLATELTPATGHVDPRLDPVKGRVGSIWFTDRVVDRAVNNLENPRLTLVAPGQWTSRDGTYAASLEAGVVKARALDIGPGGVQRVLEGELTVEREGPVTVIRGQWGSRYASYPVEIRFSDEQVDMKWGFYERHLVREHAPQLMAGCVYYAQWASPTRRSDELEVCGAVRSDRPPPIQTVMAFLLNGLRRNGKGLGLDPIPEAPVLPPPSGGPGLRR